jgi:hypothetical protein
MEKNRTAWLHRVKVLEDRLRESSALKGKVLTVKIERRLTGPGIHSVQEGGTGAPVRHSAVKISTVDRIL